MSQRAHRQFIASLPGEPLGDPVLELSADERKAWEDIVNACPDVLRRSDVIYLDCCARLLRNWRARQLRPEWTRMLYRMLGNLFMPMHERRRLLFPNQPKRGTLQ